jgi:hypothetical protein
MLMISPVAVMTHGAIEIGMKPDNQIQNLLKLEIFS